MDIELKSKINLFNDIYKDTRKTFFIDGKNLNIIEALSIITYNSGFEVDKVKKLRKYILKSRFDLFNLKYRKFLSLFLYDCTDYNEFFKSTKNIYEHFTAIGFNKNKRTLAISALLSKNFKGDKLMDMADKIADIERRKNYTEVSKSLSILSVITGLGDMNIDKEKVLSLKCSIKEEIGDVPNKCLIFVELAALIIEDQKYFLKELKNIFDSLNNKNIRNRLNRYDKVIIAFSILIDNFREEAQNGMANGIVDNDNLKIIQDYIICLIYFN